MGERGNRGNLEVFKAAKLVAPVEARPVPELSRREQQAAAADILIILDNLVTEAGRESEDKLGWRKVADSASVVTQYLEALVVGETKVGEKARRLSLEEMKAPLLKALAVLFQHLPEFHRLCVEAPNVNLADLSNDAYNPFYLAFEEAVTRIVDEKKRPRGEDPALERKRRERVKLFLDPGQGEGEVAQDKSKARPLDVYQVVDSEVEAGAEALLSLVRKEAPYFKDEALCEDAKILEEFLELLVNPEHVLTRHAGEKGHSKKEQLVKLVRMHPPKLSLAELPEKVFEAALSLRAFNRNFNLVCLGHDVNSLINEGIVDDSARQKAIGGLGSNPFNLARAISQEHLESEPWSMGLSDRERLYAWDDLKNERSVTLSDFEASYLVGSEALAAVSTEKSLVVAPVEPGWRARVAESARKALLWGRGRVNKNAREEWDDTRAREKAEVRKKAVEEQIKSWLEEFGKRKEKYDLNHFYNHVVGVRKEVRDQIADGHEDLLRPELMEVIADGIAFYAEKLNPDFADYWAHIRDCLVTARTSNNNILEIEWMKFILALAEQATERLREWEKNRFLYPEQVAGFRKKKDYERVKAFPPVGPVRGENTEMFLQPNGDLRALREDGLILDYEQNADGTVKINKFVLPQEMSMKPKTENWHAVAARFLPPNGEKCWVYTSKNKLKLFENKKENETKDLTLIQIAAQLVGAEAAPEQGWKEARPIDVVPVEGAQPVFSLDTSTPMFRLGDVKYDLSEIESGTEAPAHAVLSGQLEIKTASPGAVVSTVDAVNATGTEKVILIKLDRKSTDGAFLNVNKTFSSSPVLAQPGSNFLVDYYGTTILYNGQFFYREGNGPELKNGPTTNLSDGNSSQWQRTWQLLNKNAYLARVTEFETKELSGNAPTSGEMSNASMRLMIKKPGEMNGGVVITEENGENTAADFDICFARMQPDGSVLVGKKDGTIEIFDGEKEEPAETIEQRLVVIEDAVKMLEDREPSSEIGGDGRKIYGGPAREVVRTHKNGTTTTWYGDWGHEAFVDRCEENLTFFKDRFSKISATYPTESQTKEKGALTFELYQEALEELRQFEENLKNTTMALYIADDVRTEPAIRQGLYEYLRGVNSFDERKPDYNKLTEEAMADAPDDRAKKAEVLIDFYRALDKTYPIAWKSRAGDTDEKADALISKIEIQFHQILLQVGQATESEWPEIERLAKLFDKAKNIAAIPVESDAPLSAYVEKGKLRPEVSNNLTQNILATQDLLHNNEFDPSALRSLVWSKISHIMEMASAGRANPLLDIKRVLSALRGEEEFLKADEFKKFDGLEEFLKQAEAGLEAIMKFYRFS